MSGDFDISRSLSEVARTEPSRPALISPRGVLSCEELEKGSWVCASGLKKIGIEKGTRCVLMVPPGPEMVMLVFGMMRISAVPVLVDPGIGLHYLKYCLSEADPAVFIGSPKAHLARIFFGWARKSIRKSIKVGWFPLVRGASFKKLLKIGTSNPFFDDLPKPEDTAAIVFTSGSTGIPKGVVYTHRMFNAQAQILRDHFNIQPGEVDLATFPLFALFDPAWKTTTVFPDMDFTRPGKVDPEVIIKTINTYQVTHMFGSPALLNRVGKYCEKKEVSFPTIRRVLSAGAPVQDIVLDRFAALLSANSDVHTPYGATEALPLCSISRNERLQLSGSEERGICVGNPLPGVHLAIIPISDEPIPAWTEELCLSAGKVGEIVVWGDNVSEEYFRKPEATKLAKIYSDTGLVRHRMGDLGYLDQEGRLWFCGRKSHRVQTSDVTLFTIPCEQVFNRHADVFRSALVGIGPKDCQVPILCVELEPTAERNEFGRIRKELFELAASSPSTRLIQTILFHSGFPVDIRHNSKIFREKLAVWARDQLK